MTKEVLQKKLEEALKSKDILFTRLRTPNYGFRGVRYPADYVVWFPNMTALIECKQRKSFPIAPSDIRQLPFMQEWHRKRNDPAARYFLLAYVEGTFCLFKSYDVVEAGEKHKGLKIIDAVTYDGSLESIIDYLLSL